MIYSYTSFYWILKELSIVASDSVVIKSLCGKPDPRPINKFTDGSPVDSSAAQVSRRCERKGGGEVVWGCWRLTCGKGCKIHPPLVWRGHTRAGGCYALRTAPFILPELALENLNFINQLGELVEGGDGAPPGNTGFRNPTQEEELPNHNMWGHEQRNQDPLWVSGAREPIPEETLWRTFIFHWREVRFELWHQRAPPRQWILSTSQSVPQGRGCSSQSRTKEFLLKQTNEKLQFLLLYLKCTEMNSYVCLILRLMKISDKVISLAMAIKYSCAVRIKNGSCYSTWLEKYLCTSERLHFPILDAGNSFADIQRVVEQCLVFGRVLLRPLPYWWEKHSLVLSLRDGFTLGKVLQQEQRKQTHL